LKKGQLITADMMAILRTHNQPAKGAFTPGHGLTGADVCMHAGWGPIRTSQSAGSMVSALSAEGNLHWLTGTAAPCTSIFKPIWMEAGIPAAVKAPGALYDESVMFWRHEALHREILKDYSARIVPVMQDRDAIEIAFLRAAESLLQASSKEKAAFSDNCFRLADEAEARWLQAVRNIPVGSKNSFYYDSAWKKLNQAAGVPV
jgi:dipeptidase